MGTHEHRKDAPRTLDVAVLTVSTTRGPAEDRSGRWIRKRAEREGHRVVDYRIVSDDAEAIKSAVMDIIESHGPHAVLVNGGTGISPTDVTIEAIRPLFTKELSAFGALFTHLSFEEIDSAAILSRATAGIIGHTAVFCMPGSLNACKLACKNLVFPELGHVAGHILTG
ncbi:MAG: MogA/MoaB family molybdenum cofactor biosynthesis protein [Desulfobacterales bacterium]